MSFQKGFLRMGGLPTSEFQSMFGGHRGYNLGFVNQRALHAMNIQRFIGLKYKNMVKLHFISKVKASITTKPALKPTG